MKIQDRAFVSIDYALSLDSGEVVDKSDVGDPLGFIYGLGQIVPGLERELGGKEAGNKVSLVVEPEDGYGVSNPALLREIPRDKFPGDLTIESGQVFQADTPNGPVAFRVKSFDDEVIVADFNHPLAGERLHFQIAIIAVREATEEEITAATASCSSDACGGCHGDCH